MQNTQEVVQYGLVYLIIGILTLLIFALVSGFTDRNTDKSDFWAALLWPISLMELLGFIIRMFYESIVNDTK